MIDQKKELTFSLYKKLWKIRIKKSDSKAKKTWLDNSQNMIDELICLNSCNFLRFSSIQKTMFIKFSWYALYELLLLIINYKNSLKLLKENPAGDPQPFIFYPLTSANTVHTLYHISVLEKFLDIKLKSFKQIVEFGAGYGNMARIAYKLGFKGKYLILDLPVSLALQEYYLSLAKIYDSELRNMNEQVYFQKKFPTSFFNNKGKKLLIATWSLSEAPLRDRRKVVKNLNKFDAILIAFQKKFHEVDNLEYFEEIQKVKKNFIWELKEIMHIRGSYYLLGKKKKLY